MIDSDLVKRKFVPNLCSNVGVNQYGYKMKEVYKKLTEMKYTPQEE